MRTLRYGMSAIVVLGLALLLSACGKNDNNMAFLPSYTVGGVVSGYTGTGLVLQNNGQDDLVVSTGSTTFVFTSKVALGSAYKVSIKSEPTNSIDYQVCTVTNGTGNMPAANVENVQIDCTLVSWETLTNFTDQANFTDFTPAGESTLYTAYGNLMYVYSFPTASVPLGEFTPVADPLASISSYDGLAWVGNKLYVAEGNSMFVYSIATNSWSEPVNTLTHAHNMTQTTGDDSGHVYSMATDTSVLLIYNTSDDTYEYVDAPNDLLSTHEPRAAWDSKTKRVYLMDYNTSSSFYAFNPVDKSFTLLADMPAGTESTDAFCSDRRGRIFTGFDGSSTVYVYSADTDTWDALPDAPFSIGNSPACTISADGWLFLSDSSVNFARIKVF